MALSKQGKMLSDPGLTLEQFAALMEGLGYRAERGRREKVRPVLAPRPAGEPGPAGDVPVMDAAQEPAADAGHGASPADQVEAADTGDVPDYADRRRGAGRAGGPGRWRRRGERHDFEASEQETAIGARPESEAGEPETEGFYYLHLGGQPAASRREQTSQAGRRPQEQCREGQAEARPVRQWRTASSSAPPKKERIDPDNPFAAALMGLRTSPERRRPTGSGPTSGSGRRVSSRHARRQARWSVAVTCG